MIERYDQADVDDPRPGCLGFGCCLVLLAIALAALGNFVAGWIYTR